MILISFYVHVTSLYFHYTSTIHCSNCYQSMCIQHIVNLMKSHSIDTIVIYHYFIRVTLSKFKSCDANNHIEIFKTLNFRQLRKSWVCSDSLTSMIGKIELVYL